MIGLRTDLIKTPVPNLSNGFLFTTKLFEIVAAWPLVYGAFYMIARRKEIDRGKKTPAAEKDKHAKKN